MYAIRDRRKIASAQQQFT
ncbi:hypothetical protein B4U80_07829 [Leptotrombidium deliense]|uniref:Uncharacterized protein n=1 Tax=Leptotrombidium deliense TaxID=299467 RepID=A0A443SJU9_9ACAR|nr:hypothetical protein B4U80_07829 [Leptotrombidium deliense]